jgi:hypothetical protein
LFDRDNALTVEHEATRLTQDRYAPPGVIVDDQLNVVQFRGQTEGFSSQRPANRA